VSCTNGPPASAANCDSADLTNANLTHADLSGATLSANTTDGPVSIFGLASGSANLSGADLAGADISTAAGYANFTGADLAGAILTNGDFGAADFTDANLTDAALTGAEMSSVVEPFGISVSATLTGANVTGTILVPGNQTSIATSQSGAVVTWSMPPGIPGATPGSCTPPSGSTFPPSTSTVTCRVSDNNGDLATGTFTVTVESLNTSILIPSGGATVSGTATTLDASASNATSVEFLLFGGSFGYNAPVICTATLTPYGWLGSWNTTTVPNGNYTLVSEASGSGGSIFSGGVAVTVTNNVPPTTTVLIPSQGATVSGTAATLDASASNATSVEFLLFGGSFGYNAPILCTATLTQYGWLCAWKTTTVPNGSYTLVSEASGSGGTAYSSGVSVTVKN
jgi:hypothetical protein